MTLVFYAIDKNWWTGTEPLLNLIAAAAQMSSFTHVELAIGEEFSAHGEMSNVLRIFNDSVGVEMCRRTGKNPNYQYVQLGCSKKAVTAMQGWAQKQVGKPFSSTGMARSIIWPRETTGDSFYCAELIAACLKVGGLMSTDSKPGAATPHSLYKLYKSSAAIMANPCTLRQQFGMPATRSISVTPGGVPGLANQAREQKRYHNMQFGLKSIGRAMPAQPDAGGSRRRADSPPRMQFRVLQPRGVDPSGLSSLGNVTFSLASLNMSHGKYR